MLLLIDIPALDILLLSSGTFGINCFLIGVLTFDFLDISSQFEQLSDTAGIGSLSMSGGCTAFACKDFLLSLNLSD